MTQHTVSRLLDDAAQRLGGAGIERARHEARLLLAHSSGLSLTRQISDPGSLLDHKARAQFENLVARRERREPLSHLTGEREFWNLAFHVTDAVLDPRPDSETLIDAALDFSPDENREISVLDLGTGSGCLLLTVLKNRPLAYGVGVDLSPAALRVAADNANRLGLTGRAAFFCGDWGGALVGEFDLILCNPPYVRSGDLDRLEPEVVRYEPMIALDGGTDGLGAYHDLLPHIARLLRAGGAAFLEIGVGQADEITYLIENSGLHVSQRYRDLAKIERCIVVTLE